jgi:hypothetical protein
MWTALGDILRRLGLRRARRAELRALRAQFRTLPAASGANAPQRTLAFELRGRKEALLEALDDALGEEQPACRTCARGHPLPNGRWEGGHCCGSPTFNLFTPDEVRALGLGGTKPTDLRPPSSEQAGCTFRGSMGCSLAAVDRPNLCVRYLCRELSGQLARRGELRRILTLCAELDATFARFKAAGAGPEEQDELSALLDDPRNVGGSR